MYQPRLVLRDATRVLSALVQDDEVGIAQAALSADPVTMQELRQAMLRFAKQAEIDALFNKLQPGLCNEPCNDGFFLFDLEAQLMVIVTAQDVPDKRGTICSIDDQGKSKREADFHISDDWLVLKTRTGWQEQAEERRRIRRATPALDARQVFYGKPLVEHMALQVFEAFRKLGPQTKEPPATRRYEDTPQQRAIREIHALWMLTPRDDLLGKSPREVAVAHRHHLSMDLQDRSFQWTIQNACPPGLPKESHAYRFAGFNTHEMVMHYNMVRDLLWECWDRLEKLPPDTLQHMMVGDFLTSEVESLLNWCEAWLDAPNMDCHGRSARSVIQRERHRVPEVISAHDAMVDPDCPCCQMLADMPGPGFWHLDGCNMDDDFAFDLYYDTLEEWQKHRDEMDAFSRRMDEERKERESLGVTYGADGNRTGIWQTSYVSDDKNVPLGIRLFGYGGHLAELMVDLRTASDCDVQPRIDQLNREFGNLREVLSSSDLDQASALLQPVMDRLTNTLAELAGDYPSLSEKCDSLSGKLEGMLDPETKYDIDEGSDLPF